MDWLTDPATAIIVGHSHCASLGVPLRSVDGRSQLVPLTDDDQRFCGFTGQWRRTPEFWHELAAVASDRPVVLIWRGNQHQAMFLLSAGRRFDFMLHEDPDLPIDTEAELVPDRAVHERLDVDVRELAEAIGLLLQKGASRVIVAGTPPPKADQELLRRSVRSEPAFRAHAEKLGLRIDDIPLAAPMLMHKLWRVMQRHLSDTASGSGAEFVPVPPAALDQGFLRADLSANDATHANAEFGRIMRDELHTRLQRRDA